MPIDPTSTEPGLTPIAAEPATIHMRCRRDKCESILAIEVSPPNSPHRMYRCVKCHHPVGVATGGTFNF